MLNVGILCFVEGVAVLRVFFGGKSTCECRWRWRLPPLRGLSLGRLKSRLTITGVFWSQGCLPASATRLAKLPALLLAPEAAVSDASRRRLSADD